MLLGRPKTAPDGMFHAKVALIDLRNTTELVTDDFFAALLT